VQWAIFFNNLLLFDENSKITGVLLEGTFPSLFQNRISPFRWDKVKNIRPARMAIFSDGNMAENQLDKGTPLELGYDKWTNNLYANKQLLQNTVHYLMGENKRLVLRSNTCKGRKKEHSDKVIYPATRRTCFSWTYLRGLTPQDISSITFDKFLFGLFCFKIYLKV